MDIPTYTGYAQEWPPGLYTNQSGSIHIIVMPDQQVYAGVSDHEDFTSLTPEGSKFSYQYIRIGDL